jgi:superfamily II DNA helicase RecQ
LIQIAVNLPDNRARLKKINGVGKKTLEKYGDDILALVADYRNKTCNRRGKTVGGQK